MLNPRRYLGLALGFLLLVPACRQAQDPADYTVPYGVEVAPPRGAPAAGGVAQSGAMAAEADTLPEAPGAAATSVAGERAAPAVQTDPAAQTDPAPQANPPAQAEPSEP